MNWCVETKRLSKHDLARIAKADERSDPRRKRRSLTEQELVQLLEVARKRPLIEARTVRRGQNRGKQLVDLRLETIARLERVGEERALIYKTLVLTGLRVNELRTLKLYHLDMTPSKECIQLEAKLEKSREGNTLPIRSDLADVLRAWLQRRLQELQTEAEVEQTESITTLPPDNFLFDVPTGLLKILDRDLRASGIPKRDDRGRTIDVHAIRTTFGTLLSQAGVLPRVAQQAMRHSDIKLTMGVYTDPRLLDVRSAMEGLPTLPLIRETDLVAPQVAPTPDFLGQKQSVSGTVERKDEQSEESEESDKKPYICSKKPSLTSQDISEGNVGLAGFEPTTSCTPSKHASQAAPQPDPSVLWLHLLHGNPIY